MNFDHHILPSYLATPRNNTAVLETLIAESNKSKKSNPSKLIRALNSCEPSLISDQLLNSISGNLLTSLSRNIKELNLNSKILLGSLAAQRDNIELAKTFLQELAKNGNHHARFILAAMWVNLKHSRNKELAHDYIIKAAEHGLIEAKSALLGLFVSEQINYCPIKTEAISRELLKNNSAIAHFCIYYLSGNKKLKISENDGIKHLHIAARLGFERAKIEICSLVFDGKDATYSEVEAIKIATEFAEQGNKIAICLLGQKLLTSSGYELGDPAELKIKGLIWLKKAADLDIPLAQRLLAISQLHDDPDLSGNYNVIQGENKLRELFKSGDRESGFHLAKRMFFDPKRENLPECRTILKACYEMGEIEAAQYLGLMMIQSGEIQSGLKILEEAIENGSISSLVALGGIYLNGTYGTEQNIEKAIECFTKALVDKSEAIAPYQLARLAIFRPDIEKDFDKAATLSMRSGLSGYKPAFETLAVALFQESIDYKKYLPPSDFILINERIEAVCFWLSTVPESERESNWEPSMQIAKNLLNETRLLEIKEAADEFANQLSKKLVRHFS